MCKKNICWIWVTALIAMIYSISLSQEPYQITYEAEGISDFVWSPDGSQFAYIALENDTTRLFLIDVNGNNRTKLTNSYAYGGIDWKGDVITFKSAQGTGSYDGLIKRIDPNGISEIIILGPYWYGSVILREDADWILYEDAPNGWWQANRCNINGSNNLILETADLVQQVGWFGKTKALYGRGPNYNTVCGIHKINFDGTGHVQLTAQNLPNNSLFIGSPDTNKILYCNGTSSIWDIWIMDSDGSDQTQITFDPAHDYLCNTRDNVWTKNCKSFYFVSDRSGNGDIYKMTIDGRNLFQITNHDSMDYLPIPSPDGTKLAFLSKRDSISNIWICDLSAPHISSINDVPYDQGGFVTIKWQASGLDSDEGSIPFYSIWRALPEGVMPKNSPINLKDITKNFTGSAYRSLSIDGKVNAFEWIANQPAHGFSFYTYTAPTLYDSMSTTNGMHYFLVSAHTNQPNIFYDSNIDSGYSVDNCPPLPPSGLDATVSNNTINLSWDESPEPDLQFYIIYRNDFRYDSTSQTQYQDINVVIGENYTYKLTAIDVHENISEFSNEITASILNGIDEMLDIPITYQLSQNFPNPFNPTTQINYSLPKNCYVLLEVWNIQGQKVATLIDEKQNKGYKVVTFDGRYLSSGIYYYHLKTTEFNALKKMILVK